MPKSDRAAVDGVLLLDKPAGLTSNAALQRARRLFGAAKAGHTGTLDPLATGLLPLAFGEATKFSQLLLDADKRYGALVRLGVETTTGDAEGEVIARRAVKVSREEIARALERFRGEIHQVPPMFSALKREGRTLYELARQGISVEREARPVTLYRLDLLDCGADSLLLDVLCSKGTYIRTLATDIGVALGCGAHVAELRRLAIGTLQVDDAVTLDAIEACPDGDRGRWLAPVDALAFALPMLTLDADSARRLMTGQAIACAEAVRGATYRIYAGGRFLGLGQAPDDLRLAPKRLVVAATDWVCDEAGAVQLEVASSKRL